MKKTLWILVVLLVVVTACSLLIARVSLKKARSIKEEAKQASSMEITVLNQKIERLEKEAVRASKILLKEVQKNLLQAAISVSEGNFGEAKALVEEAGRDLGVAGKITTGEEKDFISALQGKVAYVSGDIEATSKGAKGKLLDLAQKIENRLKNI